MTASQYETPPHAPGLLEAMWRFWWIPLVLGLLGLTVGGIVGSRLANEYAATTSFTLGQPVSVEPVIKPTVIKTDRHILNEVSEMRGAAVRTAASEALGGDPTPGQIGGAISIGSGGDSDLIALTATDPSPEKAAEIANAVRAAYSQNSANRLRTAAVNSALNLDGQITAKDGELTAANTRAETLVTEVRNSIASFTSPQDRENQVNTKLRSNAEFIGVQRSINEANDALSALRTRRNELAALAGNLPDTDTPAFGGYIIDTPTPAEVPSEPDGLSPSIYRLLGALAGLGVGAIGAWWLAEQLPKPEPVRSGDVARDLGAPLLVELNGLKGSDSVTIQRAGSDNGSAYDDLLFSTLHRIPGGVRNTIAVIGPKDAPRPSVAANLAIAASRKGMSVVLVDADVNASTLSKAASAADAPGLINMGDSADVAHCVGAWPDAKYELDFVGIGSGQAGDASRFFRNGGLNKALEALAQQYDVIILNGPSIPGSGHAQAVADEASFSIVTVSNGADTDELDALAQRLSVLGGQIAGVAVTRSSRPWWQPASIDQIRKKVKR